MAKEPTTLWTYAQIGDLTGKTAATLRVWRKREKLPDPDYLVGDWPAWKPETIKAWWSNSAADVVVSETVP